MKAEETEILVIGAGPAGLIAAREAAQRGVEVTVLEEDAEIGRPCHCAGLLSLRGLENISLPPHRSFVQNMVKGAHFFSPSGLSFTVERDEPVACIVDRSLFDKFLAEKAAEAGAKIKLNAKVCSIKRVGTEITVRWENGSSKAKVVIDAEGVSSRMVKAFGLKPLNPSRLLPGLQFDLKGVKVDKGHVEIHTGKSIAPNFFAWVIPLDEKSARVGLACKEANPNELLEIFIKYRFGNGKVSPERVAARAGQIVACGPIEKTFDDNVMVVGDAAGQVKPTTGGGVIFGGICASIAGQVAAEAVIREDSTGVFLRRYETLWKRRLGKEFKTGLLARRIMNSLSDNAVERLFKVVIDGDLMSLLSAEGDLDFQSGILLKLIEKKEILRILPSFLRYVISF